MKQGQKKNQVLLIFHHSKVLLDHKAALESLNLEIFIVRSTQEALKVLETEQSFAFILIEAQVPVMDGLEAVERIKGYPGFSNVPIIFTNLQCDEAFIRSAYQIGVTDFIFTPIEEEVIRLKVTRFIELDKKRSELGEQEDLFRKAREYDHIQMARKIAIQKATAYALTEANSIDEALSKIIKSTCETMGWCSGDLWEIDNDKRFIKCKYFWNIPGLSLKQFRKATMSQAFSLGEGLPGRIWKSGKAEWIHDVLFDENFPRLPIARKEGLHTAVAFPLLLGNETLGVIEFFSSEFQTIDSELLEILTATGNQIAQFLKRSKAIKELAESNAFKAAILESALDCIISMDSKGNIIEFNPAAEKTFGYSREEAIGRDMASLIIPANFRAAHREGLLRFLQTGKGQILGRRVEISAIRKDGGEFPVELTVTVVPGEGDPRFTGYLRDITERVRSEQSLRSSEEMLRIALDAGQMGEWDLDLVTGHSYRAFRHDQCFGYGQPIKSWTYEDFLEHVHPEDRVQVDQKFKAALTGEKDWQFECRIVWPDQSIHWISAAGRVKFDESGKPIRMAGLVYDITGQKESEFKLKAALRSRDEFLSIASHELKTPITSLKLQLQMARRGFTPGTELILPPEKLIRFLDLSLIQTDRLSAIIDDLLDISRIGSGKLVFNFKEVDVVDLVSETVEKLVEEFRSKGSSIKFNADESIYAYCDRFRMEQVITNLLSNAAKYGGGKPVKISVVQSSDRVRIIVQDYGMGISKENQEKIFERFERAIDSTNISGLGLGLYISREIVCAHKGEIHVESRVGQGSTFTVDIPKRKECKGSDNGQADSNC
jgi:PAS domain S-box-containing protein